MRFCFIVFLCTVYSYLLRTRLSPSILENTRTIHAIMIHVVYVSVNPHKNFLYARKPSCAALYIARLLLLPPLLCFLFTAGQFSLNFSPICLILGFSLCVFFFFFFFLFASQALQQVNKAGQRYLYSLWPLRCQVLDGILASNQVIALFSVRLQN